MNAKEYFENLINEYNHVRWLSYMPRRGGNLRRMGFSDWEINRIIEIKKHVTNEENTNNKRTV